MGWPQLSICVGAEDKKEWEISPQVTYGLTEGSGDGE